MPRESESDGDSEASERRHRRLENRAAYKKRWGPRPVVRDGRVIPGAAPTPQPARTGQAQAQRPPEGWPAEIPLPTPSNAYRATAYSYFVPVTSSQAAWLMEVAQVDDAALERVRDLLRQVQQEPILRRVRGLENLAVLWRRPERDRPDAVFSLPVPGGKGTHSPPPRGATVRKRKHTPSASMGPVKRTRGPGGEGL